MTNEHLTVIREFQKLNDGGENWKDFYVIKGDHVCELREELECCFGRALESLNIYNDANCIPAGGVYHGSIVVDGLDSRGNTVVYQSCGYNI